MVVTRRQTSEQLQRGADGALQSSPQNNAISSSSTFASPESTSSTTEASLSQGKVRSVKRSSVSQKKIGSETKTSASQESADSLSSVSRRRSRKRTSYKVEQKESDAQIHDEVSAKAMDHNGSNLVATVEDRSNVEPAVENGSSIGSNNGSVVSDGLNEKTLNEAESHMTTVENGSNVVTESSTEVFRNTYTKVQEYSLSNFQSPPIALRTRSRSYCSSTGSVDEGSTAATHISIAAPKTPKKRLSVASTPRRTRASLQPQLAEICEEKPTRKNDDGEGKLVEDETDSNLTLRETIPEDSSTHVKSKDMSRERKEMSASLREVRNIFESWKSSPESSEKSENSSTHASSKDGMSPKRAEVANSSRDVKNRDKSSELSTKSSENSPISPVIDQEKQTARTVDASLAKNIDVIKNMTHLSGKDLEGSSVDDQKELSVKILEKASAVDQQISKPSDSEKLPTKKHKKKFVKELEANDRSKEETNRKAQEKECDSKLSMIIWPLFDNPSSLWTSRDCEKFLMKNIEKAYAFMNEVDATVPTISQELITTDDETVWQQIAYGNKKFQRYFTKQKHLLDIELQVGEETMEAKQIPISITEPGYLDESSDADINGDNDGVGDDDDDDDDDDVDLFKLTDDQIKDLEKNHDNDNGDGESDSDESAIKEDFHQQSKKHRKSIVDDRFFSLAEMEEYLDKEEKSGTNVNAGFFEQYDKDGDDSVDTADYHYADYFEGTDNDSEDDDVTTPSKKSKTTDTAQKSSRKKVRFADEISGSSSSDGNGDPAEYDTDDEHGVDSNNEDDSFNDDQDGPVLLGKVQEKDDNESEFQRRQKKLQERIASIEAANLAPRSWDLSGEVTAMDREENTMLEKHVDFDQSAPCPPVITVDSTAQMEAMIIQRIKDKAFDDVVRTYREPETSATYRAPVAEEEVVKKSLAEVYEEQYQKTQYGANNEEKTNEKHEEIKKLMSSLFQKLNALSHYRYIPPEIRPEVRIVNNMPSLQKEEVGPMASTDAVLLAPEEIHKHVSGPIKGDDEKTKTDRSRAHRKKKKWQHINQLKKQHTESSTKTDSEVPLKKRKLIPHFENKKNIKLTSTSFFERLQATATEEVRNRKSKMIESGLKKKKSSASYKL